MELISKEVVRRIIDSERTKEQMLGMVECAVTFESSTDCISRKAVHGGIEMNTDIYLFATAEELKEVIPQRTNAAIVVHPTAREALKSVREEIKERKRNSGGEPNRELAFNVCLGIIDKHMEQLQKGDQNGI